MELSDCHTRVWGQTYNFLKNLAVCRFRREAAGGRCETLTSGAACLGPARSLCCIALWDLGQCNAQGLPVIDVSCPMAVHLSV